jgi:hypothetical protein
LKDPISPVTEIHSWQNYPFKSAVFGVKYTSGRLILQMEQENLKTVKLIDLDQLKTAVKC